MTIQSLIAVLCLLCSTPAAASHAQTADSLECFRSPAQLYAAQHTTKWKAHKTPYGMCYHSGPKNRSGAFSDRGTNTLIRSSRISEKPESYQGSGPPKKTHVRGSKQASRTVLKLGEEYLPVKQFSDWPVLYDNMYTETFGMYSSPKHYYSVR